jgi:choline dehydrogenase-like flavoprotein
MHRLTPEGPVARPLDEELEEIAGVFRGAAAVAAHDLGLELANESEAAQFRVWAKSPDVGGDIRMMVPVFFDVGRQQTKVWAILGWATRSLVVDFAAPPTAHVLGGQVRVEFGPALKRIAYPVFWEGYVRTVLDRREFRAHCDRHRSGSRIVREL